MVDIQKMHYTVRLYNIKSWQSVLIATLANFNLFLYFSYYLFMYCIASSVHTHSNHDRFCCT